MTNHSDQTNSQHKPGEMLTKMEVCHLFCERLRISKSTYYNRIYPRLKFNSVDNELSRFIVPLTGPERMPYSVAIGLINIMTENRQDDDLSKAVLKKYLK